MIPGGLLRPPLRNGITHLGAGRYGLGGALTQATEIAQAGYNLGFTGANSKFGIGTAAPAVRAHIVETYAVNAEVFRADFGAIGTALRYYAGSSTDFMTLAVGANLLLQRNGGSNPSIRAVGRSLALSGDTGIQVSSLSTGSPGNLQFIGDYGLGVPGIGPNNAATSAFCVKNYSAGQMVTFRVDQGTFHVGDSGVASNPASAIFSLDSTTRGFLPPRMTTAQRTSIVSPAISLMVYDTTTNNLYIYKPTGWTIII